MRASSYPQSSFPEPLSWLVDEERRAAFEESDGHFESVYHFVATPTAARVSRPCGWDAVENRPTEGVDWRGRLDSFVAETDRVFDLLDGVMPEIAWLDDSQTLTYLHATVTRRYRVGVPDVPFHIDALLADAALVGGAHAGRSAPARGVGTRLRPRPGRGSWTTSSGPDLDSATQGELIATSARQNNALRRTGSGWAFYIEAERMRASSYPQSSFPEPLSWLVDEERRAAFEESDGHFESVYHFTLQHLPPQESRARAAGMLYENRPTEGVDWRGRLDSFVAETDRVFDLLDGVMPEIAWLDDSQTLTYLHATVSTRRYRVGVRAVPYRRTAGRCRAGRRPGAHAGRSAPARGVGTRLPDLDLAGDLGRPQPPGLCVSLEYALLCLDKAEAERVGRLRRQWFAKRKNVIALLRETIFQQESPLVDTDASNKAADADAALQELGAIKSPSATSPPR